MNPEYGLSLDDITFSINGVGMGKLEAVDVSVPKVCTPEIDLKERDNLFLFDLNKGFTITMEDVKIDPQFINTILPANSTYKVVMESKNYPRGNKLPKKKRIRNKWIKKYHREIVLDNCVIL